MGVLVSVGVADGGIVGLAGLASTAAVCVMPRLKTACRVAVWFGCVADGTACAV